MLHFGNYDESEPNKEIIKLWKYFLGTDISVDGIYRLIGAPEGSTVTASYCSWICVHTGLDRPPAGIYFDIDHPDFVSCIGIYRTQDNFRLYIKDFHKKQKSKEKGIAGQCLFQMSWMTHLLNIDEINLLGWGGRLCTEMDNGTVWSGYSTWPKYGFDMQLHNKDQDLAFQIDSVNTGMFSLFPHRPKQLNDCATLQDILKKSEGEEWWKICGTGWFMTFRCRDRHSGNILVNLLQKNHHSLYPPAHLKESHLNLNLTKLPISDFKLTSSAAEIQRKLREGRVISAPQLDDSEFLPASPEFYLNL